MDKFKFNSVNQPTKYPVDLGRLGINVYDVAPKWVYQDGRRTDVQATSKDGVPRWTIKAILTPPGPRLRRSRRDHVLLGGTARGHGRGDLRQPRRFRLAHARAEYGGHRIARHRPATPRLSASCSCR